MTHSTKLKSDVAETAVTLKLLRLGLEVLKPIGDRLPYDLAVTSNNTFYRLQVKSAWKRKDVYIVDSRRTKTNRRRMIRSRYQVNDFDFAIVYLEPEETFYILPVAEFIRYKSEITFRPRGSSKSRSIPSDLYREAWSLLLRRRLDAMSDSR